MTDTICAVSTAAGLGAIAILRISGENAIQISDALFHSVRKKFRLSDAETHTAHFGRIIDEEGAVLDEVLVTVFRAPNSFTGEDSVEISCHGSIFIQQELLKLLLKKGCRMAEPGEFTQRAFANGKFDLSQAESIADLIASQSRASHKLAMNQMRGGFSCELQNLRERLLTFTSLVELELDFADHEELEFADRSELKLLASEIKEKISKLESSFGTGNVIKNGIPVSIIGETNAGKSTLLNFLLKEDKAIVSDIHGTTRDVVEDTVTIKGLLFRFIDTAGLRETTDVIENMGIERSFKEMEKASVVLWVVDASQPLDNMKKIASQIEPRLVDQHCVIVFNKMDLIDEEKRRELSAYAKEFTDNQIFISAKKELNTEKLEELLVEASQVPEIGENDVMVTNLRHYEALKNARVAVERVEEGMEMQISGDFLSQDIRECLHYLGEITGEITTDEVLGNIFMKFCIGK